MEKYGRQFSELNRTEKKEYIITYYKYHIITGLLGVIILFSLLNHFIFNPPREAIIDIMFVAPYLNSEKLGELEVEVKDFVESKKEDQTASIEHLIFSENNDPQTQMAMTAKLAGKANTGSLNILILDSDKLNYFKESEIFLPLDDYLTEEQILQYSDQLIVDEKGQAVAFKIKNTSRIAQLFPKKYNGYFALATTTKDMELSKEIIPLLLNEK